MPHYNGPYSVIDVRLETSTYTLNSTIIFPTFHKSQLRLFIPNNDSMFPGRQIKEPALILVDGLEEQVIDCIIDMKKVWNSYKYLVIWCGLALLMMSGFRQPDLRTARCLING